MRFAVDSNVILYVEGLNDAPRRDLARRLMLSMRGMPVIVPLQCIGEALTVMVRKAKMRPDKALAMLRHWRENYVLQETTRAVLEGADELIAMHKFSVWDSIILAAASHAGAAYFFSEDMHDGFVWQSMTIVNPFAENPAPIVRALLQ